MATQINQDKNNILNDDLKSFLKIEPISNTPKRDDVSIIDKQLPSITKEQIEFKSLFPKRKMLDESNFETFDSETLFYIFYFQQGTYEQYLAAQELKKRSWRFHKKHYLWFKRVDPPKVTTKDYEQGNYYLFDFEKNWSQRKKGDFVFKYCYLEAE